MSDNKRLKGQILNFSTSPVKIRGRMSEASERIFRARLKKLGTNQRYTYFVTGRRMQDGLGERSIGKERQRQNISFRYVGRL